MSAPTTSIPTFAPAPVAAVRHAAIAPRGAATPRRHLALGILPFIGVILFIAATISQFAGAAGPGWGPELVRNAVAYLIGWSMLGAGVSHLFFGKRISKSIGFGQNAFETEVGFADLAMGIVALMAANHSMEFSLAIIVVSSIYRVGCGLGHIRSMIREHNFAINNTAILAVNFVVPAFLLFAYATWAA